MFLRGVVKHFLDQSGLSKTLCNLFGRAKGFQVATALVTTSGLSELMGAISQCLARGGSGEILFGVDLPTEPNAIQSLLDLHSKYPETFAIRRLNSSTGSIFHPKLWSFTLRSGSRVAVIGSSNLTGGGLGGNFEANLLVNSQQAISEIIDHVDEHFSGGRSEPVDEDWLASYRDIYKQRKRVEDAVRHIRQRVRRIGEDIALEKPIPRRIAGHSFAFTGRILDWPRFDKLYPTIRRLKGTVARSVSGIKSAECLVHGDILGGRKSTRKLREARRLGVPVIHQDTFLKILNRALAARTKSHSSLR